MRLVLLILSLLIGLFGAFSFLFGQPLFGLLLVVIGAMIAVAANKQNQRAKERRKDAEEAEWRRQMLEKNN